MDTWSVQAGTRMNDVESISVKRLVQWTSDTQGDRLCINDAYPRIDTEWTVFDKGKYLYNVMFGLDVSIITVNLSAQASYIIDGARRISVLSDFQQGKISMVVQFSKMPEHVKIRPYGVPHSDQLERFAYEDYTLVEATYDNFQADQQRAFLQASVDIRTYNNVNLEDEKQLYWQANCLCPSTPAFVSEYDEADLYNEVCSLLVEPEQAALVQIMHLVGGIHRNMACSELLHFLNKILQGRVSRLASERRSAETDNAA